MNRALVRLVLATSLLALVLSATGCRHYLKEENIRTPEVSQTPTTAPTLTGPNPPDDGRPVVLFDMGHGEIFGAEDSSELGQSEAVKRIESAGFRVAVNNDDISAADLSKSVGLFIPGPMTPLTKQEYTEINNFVRRGGTVVLTIHVPFPVAEVPAHWGLPAGTQVVITQDPKDPSQPGFLTADRIKKSAVTEGVNSVFVASGWPIQAITKDADVVVATDNKTWLDVDNDLKLTKKDVTGSMGVVGVASVGSGQVIVLGDDAIFANLGIGQADNARLFDNILGLMRSFNQS